MPVHLVCAECGAVHTIPERPDVERGGTGCPECGGRPYTVRREGIAWHPDCGRQ